MPVESVKVKGLRELNRAFKRYDDDLKRELEDELVAAGEIVASDARQRFSLIDVKSASGFKSKTKGFGRVVVQQSLRKGRNRRRNYGGLQMRRGLLPAVEANEAKVIKAVEGMLDRIGRENGFE